MSDDTLIYTKDDAFVDANGRRLLLRGVNLSGSTKAPVGQPSQRLEGFWDDAERGTAEFIGRPLDLDDGSADAHLERLRGWGYNMLRYPVPWEALEHEGPGIYDEDFIDYTIRVLRKCKSYGFKVFMDPHQDVWSRFTGGSGAPYWTLLACGLNPRNFTKTTSAIIHSEFPKPEGFPNMIWSTNYIRLASQTVFTLFFAGRRYAPKCIIDGVNIQDYLQSHFIEAFGKLADRIRETAPELYDDCIIGWDSINEPSGGLIGWLDLEVYPDTVTNNLWKFTRPTPAQSLRLGMGQKQEIETWDFGSFGPKRDGKVVIDPEGVTVWADAAFLGESEEGVNFKYGWTRDPGWVLGTCVWALHGVWSPENGEILQPTYFAPKDPEPDIEGNLALREDEFTGGHWKPHVVAYMRRIYSAHPNAIAFLNPPVFAPPPEGMNCAKDFNDRVCYSPHYYDGMTLITRHWHWYNADALGLMRGKYFSKFTAVKLGESAIRKSFREQLGIYKEDTRTLLGAYPTIIGEIGIPFDFDNGRAYGNTDNGRYKGDYSSQTKALDASLFGADGEDAINYTVWNYCPDNSHRWGDQWNREDLSIWSPEDVRLDSPSTRMRKRLQKKRCSGSNSPTSRDTDRYPPSSTAVHSRAALLNNPYSAVNVSTPNGMIGQSTLSLNTLDIHSLPVSRAASQLRLASSPIQSMPNVLAEKEKGKDHSNAYAFLQSGARAVKAFCRPWPVATVGRITALDFDIGKAELKMSVSVSSSSVDRSRLESGDVGKRDPNELVTEIYVPLIHYASDEVILDTFLSADEKRMQGDDMGDSSSPLSPVTAQPGPLLSAPMLSQATSVSSTSDSSPASTIAPTLSARSRVNYPISSSDYALDVDISEGRYEQQGQYLRWFYPLPEKGEPDVEYTITIRRTGGAITDSAVKRIVVASGRVTDGELHLLNRGWREEGQSCLQNVCEWVDNVAQSCVVM